MRITTKILRQIIKEEVSKLMGEERLPDKDYKADYEFKQAHGVESPEHRAEKKRSADFKAKAAEIQDQYLDILKSNEEASKLFDEIQDHGYANNYNLSGVEEKLQTFLGFFPKGPVRKVANLRVTYFH